MGHSVQVESRPDTEEMRLLLEHLFDGDLDGCHNGLIELCWTDANTGALSRAQLFGTDEIEDLIAKAYEVNSVEGQNVYIGAALRKPDTQRGQRCSDMDFFALTAAFADFDDEEAVERFKERGKFALPTIVVTTGKEPHTRFQAWWRLEEPIRDPEAARRQCSGLVAALGSDEKVVNPGRVMRLGGSIAWPKKDGRVKEVTTVQAFSNAPKVYEPGRLERAYPPVDVVPTENKAEQEITREKTTLGFEGDVTDGREAHLRDLIYPNMLDLAAQLRRYPTAEELTDVVWGVFERTTDLSRPGHNTKEFCRQKCAGTLRRWREGKIHDAPTLDEAMIERGHKANANQKKNPQKPAETGIPVTGQSNDDQERHRIVPRVPNILHPEKRMVRDWLVKDIFLRRVCTLIGGSPGAGKTSITMQILVSMASGVDFMNIGITRQYKCWLINDEEDYEELEGRLEAIIQHFGVDAQTVAQNLSLYSGVDEPKFIAARRDSHGAVVEVEHVQDVRGHIVENKFDVVLIDPFVQSHQVGENANEEIGKVAEIMRTMCISKEHSAACCIIHHLKKPPQGEAQHTPGDMNSIRGGSAIAGEAHLVLTVLPAHPDMMKDVGLDKDEYVHYARMDSGKNKGGPLGATRWFRKYGEPMQRLSRKENALIPTEVEEVGVFIPVDMDKESQWTLEDRNNALKLIRSYWDAGEPLTARDWTDKGRKYFADELLDAMNIPPEIASAWLKKWIKKGIVKVDARHPGGARPRGIKVTGDDS